MGRIISGIAEKTKSACSEFTAYSDFFVPTLHDLMTLADVFFVGNL
jgi:hypothetical protein